MENEIIQISALSPTNIRKHSSSLVVYNLPVLIEGMKHSRAWTRGELDSMILLKTPDKRVVLTTIHKGTEINFSRTDESITFQVVDGEINFCNRKESVDIKKGQLLTIHEKGRYSLTSIEDTVFIITISSGLLKPAEN